jgi:hypothetical protein
MSTTELIAAIDEELSRLQQARALLSGGTTVKAKVGRPATHFAFGANKPKKKRVMSAEAREKIAAAQRKRWAKQKAAKSK